MSDMMRFGVSMSSRLLEQFDRLIEEKGYSNRSEAIRDLVRNRLVEEEWTQGDVEVVGAISLLYSHDVRELTHKLTEFEHDHHGAIISTMHIHLTEHNCLEILAIRGQASEVREIAERLISIKGVRHGKLIMTTMGEELM